MNKQFRMAWIAMGIVIVVGGCNWRWQPRQVQSRPAPAMIKAYASATEAYNAGKYDEAAKQFESIRVENGGGEIARMALYGLACAKLMAANTPQEYHDALLIWNAWVECAPRHLAHENPVMMAPLVKGKMLFSNIRLTQNKTDEIEDDETVPRWVLIKTKQEMENLNSQLEMMSQSREQDKKKISALENEITKLKSQIRALETIDQKIQKKKDAIPSAD